MIMPLTHPRVEPGDDRSVLFEIGKTAKLASGFIELANYSGLRVGRVEVDSNPLFRWFSGRCDHARVPVLKHDFDRKTYFLDLVFLGRKVALKP